VTLVGGSGQTIALKLVDQTLADGTFDTEVLRNCFKILPVDETKNVARRIIDGSQLKGGRLAEHDFQLSCMCLDILGFEAKELARRIIGDSSNPGTSTEPLILMRCLYILQADAKPAVNRLLNTPSFLDNPHNKDLIRLCNRLITSGSLDGS